MATPQARPCRGCETDGGSRNRSGRPKRIHGYCARCYSRAKERGEVGPIAPCLSCGESLPHRGRGLCVNCYERARDQGLHTAYPACGAVPVPYLGHVYPDHPAALPPTMTRQQLGYHVHHDAAGRPLDRHMTMGALWIPEAEIAADEAFADDWLKAHPWQQADWDAPGERRAA